MKYSTKFLLCRNTHFRVIQERPVIGDPLLKTCYDLEELPASLCGA